MMISSLQLVLSLISLFSSTNGCNGDQTVQVSTSSGPVLGSLRTTSGSSPYFSFQGIPYAKPPVGRLRLLVPQPPEPWTTPLNLTGDSDVRCPQVPQKIIVLVLDV